MGWGEEQRPRFPDPTTALEAQVNGLRIKLSHAQALANSRGRIIEQIRDHFEISDAQLQAILDCKDPHHD